MNEKLLLSEFHYGSSGAVVGIRFPVSFKGTNEFYANRGGAVNINHAKVNVQGFMKFYNNYQSRFGGAIRLGELTWVR